MSFVTHRQHQDYSSSAESPRSQLSQTIWPADHIPRRTGNGHRLSRTTRTPGYGPRCAAERSIRSLTSGACPARRPQGLAAQEPDLLAGDGSAVNRAAIRQVAGTTRQASNRRTTHNRYVCARPCTSARPREFAPIRQGGTVWLHSGSPGQSRSVTARAARRALPLIMILCTVKEAANTRVAYPPYPLAPQGVQHRPSSATPAAPSCCGSRIPATPARSGASGARRGWPGPGTPPSPCRSRAAPASTTIPRAASRTPPAPR